jgi:Na+/H+ antiporter NhaD/arsenite permease-like protein
MHVFDNPLIPALILFAATYVLLLVLPKWRAIVALASAALFLILGILPIDKLFFSIDWNVLMMIGGTMGLVYLFIESKMPALLADLLIKKTPNMMWATIALSVFASIISAFVDNVATVIMVAPIAITISKKLGISPVKSIICIAISSNLQGAATLVGDTTSILLGGHANMNFLDFFVYQNRPGMFFVVQLGALASVLVLMALLRKDKQEISITDKTVVTDYFPTVLMLLMIVLLIGASFIPADKKPAVTNGIICVGLFLVGVAVQSIRAKSAKTLFKSLKEIDFFTLLLLGGLFVVVAGINEAGVIDEISKLIVKISGNNVFAVYSILVWLSVLLSAFIDNIPYVMTMLPVAGGIAAALGISPTVLYFGLLCGATLGGNLTPIGASANIAGLGILRKEGHEVKAWDFMKISIPFTLAAVTTGYVLIWLFWGI